MSQKTIQLNPAFLKTSRSQKSKTRSKKQKIKSSKMPTNTHSMRNQLLKKIKDYQKNTEDNIDVTNKDVTNKDVMNKKNKHTNKKVKEDFSDEFNKSLDFLQHLSTNKKKSTKKKKQLEKNNSIHTTQISNLVNNVSQSLMPHEIKIATELPYDMMETSNMSVPKLNTTVKKYHKEPEYGCLKNGSKPLYRDWKRNTQKNIGMDNIPEVNMQNISLNINETNETNETNEINKTSLREDLLKKTKEDFQRMKLNENINIYDTPKDLEHRVKTKTFQLGKQKKSKRVGVLVKNRDTRKRIKEEHSTLKQKSILEVKNYLRKKNLLKAGSDAPPDILRSMYENAILTGDISNNTNETLMHNFYNA